MGPIGTCTSICILQIEKIDCNLVIGLLAVALYAGALCAGALWAAHFKLNMEKDFYTIGIFKFSICFLLFKEVVFQYVRLLY